MVKYKKSRSRSRKRNKRIIRKHVYSLAESLAREGIQEKLQDTLEAERDEILGRGYYERTEAPHQPVYWNGYHKAQCLVCGCGSVEIRVPRLIVAYESEIVPHYHRLTPEMKSLLSEPYLHGLSTGDFEPALGLLLDEGAPLQPTTIVKLKEKWEAEFDAWKSRPLEQEYLYVWADGVYPKGGPIDDDMAVLVVVVVNRRGEKELLAIEEGYHESYQSWSEVFRNMKKR